MERQRGFSWLALDGVPRTLFESPPITLAVCQIRFNQSLTAPSPAMVTQFQEILGDRYPDSRSETGVQFDLAFGQGMPAFQSSPTAPVWRFSDMDDDWAVSLGPDFLSLETRKYSDFNEFRERLQTALVAASKSIRPKYCTRIGLRYINEIRAENMEWQTMIRPELLGPIGVKSFAENAVQSVGQIALAHDKDRLNMAHGVFPNGSVVSPKQGDTAPEGPFYLIDMDAFREYVKADRFEFHQERLITVLDDLHDGVSSIFRWAITPELSAQLEK